MTVLRECVCVCVCVQDLPSPPHQTEHSDIPSSDILSSDTSSAVRCGRRDYTNQSSTAGRSRRCTELRAKMARCERTPVAMAGHVVRTPFPMGSGAGLAQMRAMKKCLIDGVKSSEGCVQHRDGVIDPSSRALTYWSGVLIVATAFNAVCIPLRIAFVLPPADLTLLSAFDAIADVRLTSESTV